MMGSLAAQRLSGRVALVTGGLRGIGLGIVQRFIAEGAQTVLCDLDAEDSEAAGSVLEQLGADALYVRANVACEDDWTRVADQLREWHGRLDILVNNAGTDLNGPVESLELAAWRRIMSINVDGVFLGTRQFVPLLAESGASLKGGASIINISSIMGMVGFTDISAYNATKGAVRSFTKGIAIEFAQKRLPIRANSIHPGFVMTPLLQAGFQRWADSGAAESMQQLIDGMESLTPIGRLALPEEIAGAAFFLASEDSSYVTGAELVVDGGWTAQ